MFSYSRLGKLTPMPISASSLPWWGWLLCSLGAFIVGGIAHLFTEGKNNGCLSILVAALAGLTGIVTGVMSVVVLIKTLWKG